MANKYIRHGATYNGDGTSPNLATSNGGVGAWNNINILTGTAPAYGTLAAGDVVYIRSKDESGSDLNIAHSAASYLSIGSSVATATSTVSWIIDNGQVWAGVDGKLTITVSGTSSGVQVLANNKVQAATKGAFSIVTTVNGSTVSGMPLLNNGARVDNALIDTSSRVSGSGWSVQVTQGAVISNTTLKWGIIPTANVPAVMYFTNGTAINVDIELTNSAISTGSVFEVANDSACSVYGGRVWGNGAISGQKIAGQLGGTSAEKQWLLHGFEYPRAMATPSGGTLDNYNSWFAAFGADGGAGSVLVLPGGEIDSRTDGLYPRLNATLPTSTGAGWSYKIQPRTADAARRLVLPMSKFYTETAAIKTVTLQLLVAAGFTAVNSANTYMCVDYVDDSTGAKKTVSSLNLAGVSLAASSADWLPNVGGAVTYGATALNKRLISLTTPTSIKKDTLVNVTLVVEARAVNSDDLMFVDPDPQLS